MREIRAAIGNINTIAYTNKSKLIMKDKHKVMTIFGSTGNGKSMLATLKMVSRIYKSDRSKKTYILAGRDITTLEKRFVESNYSVLNWYPFKGKWEYKKQGVGGSQIIFQTKTGKKHLYLTPFNNVSTYSRILGQTIDGIMVDEGVEADDMFLQEILARTMRTKDTWAILTSNGGDPKHFFYTGIVNASKTLDYVYGDEWCAKRGIKATPSQELRFFDSERKNDYMAYHMSLEDNPVYSGEGLKALYELYPIGSFMYYSRIMGVRGFSQDNPFGAYINESSYVSLMDLRGEQSAFYPNTMLFSVDVGGHVFSSKEMSGSAYKDGDYGTEKGGHTVCIVGAFSSDYKKFLLIDTYFPNRMIQNENANLINEKVFEWASMFPSAKRPYLFSDPADTSMLASLMAVVRNVNQVRPAIKRDVSLALDEKVIVSVIQQYMMKGNFKIFDSPNNRKYFYQAMITAKQDESGKLVDNLSFEADVWDALKYIFMSMYRILI